METTLKSAVNGALNWFKRSLYVRPIVDPWKVKMKFCNGMEFEGDILTESFEADFVVRNIAVLQAIPWFA
jgi:hypothetical protein